MKPPLLVSGIGRRPWLTTSEFDIGKYWRQKASASGIYMRRRLTASTFNFGKYCKQKASLQEAPENGICKRHLQVELSSANGIEKWHQLAASVNSIGKWHRYAPSESDISQWNRPLTPPSGIGKWQETNWHRPTVRLTVTSTNGIGICQ